MARGLRGVCVDLSELGRHLLDIACFLHPLLGPAHTDSPPATPTRRRRRSPSLRPATPPSPSLRADLAKISGSLRGGFSLRAFPDHPQHLPLPASADSPQTSSLPASPPPTAASVADDVVGAVRALRRGPRRGLTSPCSRSTRIKLSLSQTYRQWSGCGRQSANEVRVGTLVPLAKDNTGSSNGSVLSIPIFEGSNVVERNHLVVVDKRVSRKHLSLHASADGSVEVVVEGPNPIVFRSEGQRRKVCAQGRAKIAHDNVLELIPGDYFVKNVNMGDEHKSSTLMDSSDLKKGKRHNEEDSIAAKRNQ